jgi:hypothetical protein
MVRSLLEPRGVSWASFASGDADTRWLLAQGENHAAQPGNRHRAGRNPALSHFNFRACSPGRIWQRKGSEVHVGASRCRVEGEQRESTRDVQQGRGGFKDRDLYVFCANASDGILTAHPYLKGEHLQEIVGKKGYPLGKR